MKGISMSKYKLVSIRIGPTLWQEFMAACKERKTTASSVVRSLIEMYNKRHSDEKMSL